jgi:hypothetical protein
MIIAALLVLLGILLIASNPLLGLIPGLVLIVIGVVIGVLAMLGRGLGAIIGLGRRR